MSTKHRGTKRKLELTNPKPLKSILKKPKRDPEEENGEFHGAGWTDKIKSFAKKHGVALGTAAAALATAAPAAYLAATGSRTPGYSNPTPGFGTAAQRMFDPVGSGGSMAAPGYVNMVEPSSQLWWRDGSRPIAYGNVKEWKTDETQARIPWWGPHGPPPRAKVPYTKGVLPRATSSERERQPVPEYMMYATPKDTTNFGFPATYGFQYPPPGKYGPELRTGRHKLSSYSQNSFGATQLDPVGNWAWRWDQRVRGEERKRVNDQAQRDFKVNQIRLDVQRNNRNWRNAPAGSAEELRWRQLADLGQAEVDRLMGFAPQAVHNMAPHDFGEIQPGDNQGAQPQNMPIFGPDIPPGGLPPPVQTPAAAAPGYQFPDFSDWARTGYQYATNGLSAAANGFVAADQYLNNAFSNFFQPSWGRPYHNPQWLTSDPISHTPLAAIKIAMNAASLGRPILNNIWGQPANVPLQIGQEDAQFGTKEATTAPVDVSSMKIGKKKSFTVAGETFGPEWDNDSSPDWRDSREMGLYRAGLVSWADALAAHRARFPRDPFGTEKMNQAFRVWNEGESFEDWNKAREEFYAAKQGGWIPPQKTYEDTLPRMTGDASGGAKKAGRTFGLPDTWMNENWDSRCRPGVDLGDRRFDISSRTLPTAPYQPTDLDERTTQAAGRNGPGFTAYQPYDFPVLINGVMPGITPGFPKHVGGEGAGIKDIASKSWNWIKDNKGKIATAAAVAALAANGHRQQSAPVKYIDMKPYDELERAFESN